MTIKNLDKITWKRAKPIVIGFGLLIMLLSLISGVQSTNNWHKDQRFIHSQAAKDEYNSYVDSQKDIENKINKRYDLTNDYKKTLDYAYSVTDPYWIKFDSRGNEFKVKSQNFNEYYSFISDKLFNSNSIEYLVQTGNFFTTNNIVRNLSFLSFFFLIIGFLISFLDYKTNFELILFSSGYNRKEILKSKIKTSLFPILIFSAVAMGINLLLIYSRIPVQSINYPLDKIIYYQLCLFVVASCYYFIGLFSGIIFGKTFTGLISVIGFALGFELIKNNLVVLTYPPNKVFTYYGSVFSRFESYFSWLILCCIILALSFLIYLCSNAAYTRISLEERNNYLLIPKLKLPITIGASVFITYAFVGNITLNSGLSLTELFNFHIFPGMVTFVVSFIIFMFISNYKNLYEKVINKFRRHKF